MAVYNGERFLDQAIDSILDQTFPDFEFVIVDDASTDSTWQFLQEYAEEDVRVALLRNQTNQGLAKSLNRGLEIARGEYIARMDADDISLPERLGAQVSFLDGHAQVGVVGSAIKMIDANGSYIKTIRHPKSHNFILWNLCFHTPFAHPSVMFRKDVVDCVGGYDDELPVNQDRDLWQRLSSVTRFANLSEAHLLFRRHDGSITHQFGDVQARHSARAGQRMMSQILEHDVSYRICYNIRRHRFETPDAAVQAVNLIRDLYTAFMAKQTLSSLEKRKIRADAIQRVYQLYRPYWRVAKMRKAFSQFSLSMKVMPVLGWWLRFGLESARQLASQSIRRLS
jgi:glycosyltransferase involved in cell wall biosynthesis